MTLRVFSSLAVFATTLSCAEAAAPVALPPAMTRAVDFGKDIAPMLERHCLKCHGPEKQKGGYRLDLKSAAFTGGDEHAPNIVPGKGAESPLVRFVAGLDEDMIMPQKGDKLTAEEVGLLRAWIDQGAVWPDDGAVDPKTSHWAFQPLQRPPVPGIEAGNSTNPIDAFITEKRAATGLTSAPEADRRTRIRRLSFDLIGLPPTPGEIELFLGDQAANADARLIERLLASPRYGERWARHWLDVVRFAESNGFETNGPRPNAWPYRDYVIRAFNEDKPFDQFVREQIVGDALGADEATGFLVGGATDIVKSPDPVLTATQRADELNDMVATTGNAFLGLTINCARCHNHKFDPISQVDYYSMAAIFAGVKHGERDVSRPVDSERKTSALQLQADLAAIEAQLARFEPIARVPEKDGTAAPTAHVPLRPAVTRGANSERFAPVETKFVRFTILETTQLQPCIDELEVFTSEPQPRNVALGAALTASGTLPGYAIHQLKHLNDGRYGNDWSWISHELGKGWVQLEFPQSERIERVVWSRDRENVPRYNDRVPTQYRIEISPDGAVWQTVATAGDRLPQGTKPPEKTGAFSAGLTPADAEHFARLDQQRSELKRTLADLTRTPKIYAGQFSAPGEMHRYQRGEVTQPKEVIPPAVLAAIGPANPLPAGLGEQERRMALAKWITDPRHPLTARVIVNRLWHYHFGTGLVDTPSDFGVNGGRPSHPALLDWLASELIESGWSLKHLHRLIVTSATYRQASRADETGLKVDARDRLLWRFPPRRLEAEALRDAMLAVSGQLDLTHGRSRLRPFRAQHQLRQSLHDEDRATAPRNSDA